MEVSGLFLVWSTKAKNREVGRPWHSIVLFLCMPSKTGIDVMQSSDCILGSSGAIRHAGAE